MEENTLKQRLQKDINEAMKAQDKARLGVLRVLMAAIKDYEINHRADGERTMALEDTTILAIFDKIAKQHRESLKQFSDAGRQDLVEKEEFELSILQSYLPTPLTTAELEKLIRDAIGETQAQSVKDMGRVMTIIKPKVQGRADMAVVGAKIKEILS